MVGKWHQIGNVVEKGLEVLIASYREFRVQGLNIIIPNTF